MESNLIAILQSLSDFRVDFVLVGGLAAVIQGAPIHTFDVDIVFLQDEANLSRLSLALDSLDAIFRIQPSRRLKPNASHLQGGGHLNLLTKYGPLDLLASIGEDLRYPELLRNCSMMRIDSSRSVHVMTLQLLIELKEKLAGSKDLAVLPILRHTLNEARKNSGSP